jgi:hypothetical protein
MICEKCTLEFDGENCPKCESPVIIEQSETTLKITRTEQTNLPAVIEKKPTFLARAVKLIKTPVGRKVAKGVALVAVGVGMELLTQAATKNNKSQKLALPKQDRKQPHLVAQVFERKEDAPDKVVNFYAPPAGTTVTETFYYREVTVKRVTKW